MKSILISIQPKYVELIANGEKTIEVRKTRPKIETPFKCYIYATKTKECFFVGKTLSYGTEVVGEFICDKIYDIKPYFDRPDLLTQYECSWKHGEEFDCLSFSEMNSYLLEDNGYGWHISDLKIYDKPKELSDFRKPFPFNKECVECERGGDSYSSEDCSCCEYWSDKDITRPPQSWCYVEDLGDIDL